MEPANDHRIKADPEPQSRNEATVPNGFDFRDEATRNVVGAALRATYELDAPMSDQLLRLMEQLKSRLDQQPAPGTSEESPTSI